MGRRVSLARNNLFQDRRRAAMAITGVAVSLLLVLLLDGIFTGVMQHGERLHAQLARRRLPRPTRRADDAHDPVGPPARHGRGGNPS
ncbi:MAG: hypothetical protein AB7Q27_20085 [Acidimicrobiia bacterium]